MYEIIKNENTDGTFTDQKWMKSESSSSEKGIEGNRNQVTKLHYSVY